MIGNQIGGLKGTVTVQITGACPEDCLSLMAAWGVPFQGYRKTDELTAQMELPLNCIPRLERAAKKTMCSVELQRQRGIWPFLRGMGKRCLILLWLTMVTILAFWLQGHIWFTEISGNETIPEGLILQQLEHCGVGFFMPQKTLNLETVKNQMLSRMPELGWITVNFKGPVAEVVVRERQEQKKLSQIHAPGNITAKCDGLVTEVTALSGAPMVKPGDSVTKGQVLISGVDTLERTTLLTRAAGEVFARTWTKREAILPNNRMDKTYTGKETTRFSISFGKNTINFYKTSGISYEDYDKITGRTQLTLPGGYQLPVVLERITFREILLSLGETGSDDAERLLSAAVEAQQMAHMNAGEIRNRAMMYSEKTGVWYCGGILECQEEIGTVVEITD